jgi:hypothetical protein
MESGSFPATSSTIAVATNAATNDPDGTATRSQRGVSSLRWILTLMSRPS